MVMNNFRRLWKSLGFVLVAMFTVMLTSALPASAHHSYAMFDRAKETTISGTVKELQWTNPHAWLIVEVPDAKGTVVLWQIELGPPGTLVRGGFKRNTVTAGDKVTVKIYPMRSGDAGGAIVEMTTADGHVYGDLARLAQPAAAN